MKQHLVGGELLLHYILPVEKNDGHAQEQVEVISLWAQEVTRRNQKYSIQMAGTKMADAPHQVWAIILPKKAALELNEQARRAVQETNSPNEDRRFTKNRV